MERAPDGLNRSPRSATGNSVVHLNYQAVGTGEAVARPGQSQLSASQTSVGAVLVST